MRTQFSLAAVAVLIPLFGCRAPAPVADRDERNETRAATKPLIILLQTDPWLTARGSDTPRLAIYDNGEAIFLRRVPKERPAYFRKQLGPADLQDIEQTIRSFGDTPEAKPHYDLAPDVMDLPSTGIYVDVDGRHFVTTAYGLVAKGTRLGSYTVGPRRTQPDELPDWLAELHRYLAALDFADAEPWVPAQIEVMVWDYSYAPEESIVWPADWPDLSSPGTRTAGDMYLIYLPGSELTRLREFLSTRHEKGAVEIDGDKWTVSYRDAFPFEDVWMKAFGEAQRQSDGR